MPYLPILFKQVFCRQYCYQSYMDLPFLQFWCFKLVLFLAEFVNFMTTVVTKVSSCWVNTTGRQGIKQLGISFGSIFLLFSNNSSQGRHSQQPGEIPGPWLPMTALFMTELQCLPACHFKVYYFLCNFLQPHNTCKIPNGASCIPVEFFYLLVWYFPSISLLGQN